MVLTAREAPTAFCRCDASAFSLQKASMDPVKYPGFAEPDTFDLDYRSEGQR
jgi:hypothetical protein